MLKAMIYKSKSSGLRELDVILAPFATERLSSLEPDLQKSYLRLLNENSIDILNWCSDIEATPKQYEEIIQVIMQE